MGEQVEQFYFNVDENRSTTEQELVDFLFDEYGKNLSKETILSLLRSGTKVSGWLKCEVSDVIANTRDK